MKKIMVVLALLLPWNSLLADDAADAEAKIREYFDVFNATDVDAILSSIYSVPVHMGSAAGHSTYASLEDARAGLEGLYPQIKKQGWAKSVISEVKACVMADGLVFAEVNYTRDKADGEAIAPGLRSNIYVVQKMPPGWRITAFYSRDVSKGFSCNE